MSPDEIIAKGAALPRAPFPPGEGYQYSSLNTIVVGRILEKVTGQGFGDLLEARLLGPLGLDRTRLDMDGRLEPPFSHGYTDFCPNLPPLTDTSAWPADFLRGRRARLDARPTCTPGARRSARARSSRRRCTARSPTSSASATAAPTTRSVTSGRSRPSATPSSAFRRTFSADRGPPEKPFQRLMVQRAAIGTPKGAKNPRKGL